LAGNGDLSAIFAAGVAHDEREAISPAALLCGARLRPPQSAPRSPISSIALLESAYLGGFSLLAGVRVASLARWHRTMGTFVAVINSNSAETFYW